ncbi:hypothetical protein ACWF94_28820, partial [Streptomyces sp. NPDC055078]
MRLARLLCGGVFGAVLAVGLVASPAAAADGIQRAGIAAGSPPPASCGLSDWDGTACFNPKGEWFWLRDDNADGVPVAIEWYGEGGRQGVIYNDRGKAAGWTNLNKSFPERQQMYYYLCDYNVPRQE